jgi:hypothetical protein
VFICADIKGRYIIGPFDTDKEVESRLGQIDQDLQDDGLKKMLPFHLASLPLRLII